jgi:hypothetical protein
LSARSRTAAGGRQRRERRSGPLTLEEFPGIAPEALAFFNTPMEECDPDLLHSVFETFAELIEPAMSGRSRAPDVQDVFRALSSRVAAARAAAPDTPPEPPPAPAAAAQDSPGIPLDLPLGALPAAGEAAVIAAMDPQGTTPGLPDPALPQDPAGPQHPALPQADSTAGAECATDQETSAQDQPNAPPAVPPWCGGFAGNASAPGAHTPGQNGITPRRPRCAASSGRPPFRAQILVLRGANHPFDKRNINRFVPRPPRLFCYPACAGPAAILGAPTRHAILVRYARGHRLAVPLY